MTHETEAEDNAERRSRHRVQPAAACALAAWATLLAPRHATATDLQATAGDGPTCGAAIAARASVYVVEGDDGSVGSAFVFKDRHHLATAWHVVRHGANAELVSMSGKRHTFRVVAKDEDHDLALLRVDDPVEGAPLPAAERLTVGMPAFTIGSPRASSGGTQGRDEGLLRWTISGGIVTQIGRDRVQTDAITLPGNSGGPLVSCSGHVIGVAVIYWDPGLAAMAKVDRLDELARQPERVLRPWAFTSQLELGLVAGFDERLLGVSSGATFFVWDVGLRVSFATGAVTTDDLSVAIDRSWVTLGFAIRQVRPRHRVMVRERASFALLHDRTRTLSIDGGVLVPASRTDVSFAAEVGVDVIWRRLLVGFAAQIPFAGTAQEVRTLGFAGVWF